MANENLAGTYEAILPVASGEGLAAAGEKVELSHEDAELFLSRGLVREPEGDSQRQAGDSGGEGLGADDLSVAANAGREALLDAGYDTDDLVRAATDDELLALDNIGAKTLENIRETVPAETE